MDSVKALANRQVLAVYEHPPNMPWRLIYSLNSDAALRE
jgi:hypothetical protein